MKVFATAKWLLRRNTLIMFLFLAVLCGCGGNAKSSAPPTQLPSLTHSTQSINPANFVGIIDNPYMSWKPGTKMISEGTVDGAKQQTEITVSNATKIILGVTCVVVHDRVFADGHLLEDTIDWYAQDKEGNVWYFGEDSKEYKNGVANPSGSFEAGVNGAQAGIAMQGHPQPGGPPYRQEYFQGQAEDTAQIITLSAHVSVPYRHFDNLLEIKEWTPLEPGVVEFKYYAAGIGWVMTTFQGKPDEEHLTKITTGAAN